MPEPWSRVKRPTPPPAQPQARGLGRLCEDELAALVRDNLLPQATDAHSKAQWRALWRVLASYPPLRQRVVGLLDAWRDQAERELDRSDLDQGADRRLRKFVTKVDAQQRYIDAHPAWLMQLPPDARGTVRRLVTAITAHRRILLARGDQPDAPTAELWDALPTIGVDADGAAERVSEPSGYTGTLAWAGTEAARYPDPHTARLIDYLVQAIHRHRTAKLTQRLPISGTDRVLWGVLRAVGLDPQRTYTGGATASQGSEPLGWAGACVAGLTPTDRRVLDELVDAIATHRATIDPDDDIDHDHDLWGALEEVGLDPSGDPRIRIPDGYTAPGSTAGVRSGMSDTGRAVADYLTQAIVGHRAAELTAEGLEADDLPADDPCVLLWSVLDRLGFTSPG